MQTGGDFLDKISKGLGGGEGTAVGGVAGGAGGAAMGAGITVMAGIQLLEAIKGALDFIVGLLKDASGVFKAVFDLFGTTFRILIKPFADLIGFILLPIMVAILKWVVIPFYKDLLPISRAIGKWVGDNLVPWLKENAPFLRLILDAIGIVLIAAIAGVAFIITEIVKSIPTIKDMLSTAIEILGWIWNASLDLGIAFWGGIEYLIKALGEALGAIPIFGEAIKTALYGLAEGAGAMTDSLKVMKDSGNKLLDTAKNIVESVDVGTGGIMVALGKTGETIGKLTEEQTKTLSEAYEAGGITALATAAANVKTTATGTTVAMYEGEKVSDLMKAGFGSAIDWSKVYYVSAQYGLNRVPETGMYLLHRGEQVKTEREAEKGEGTTQYITVNPRIEIGNISSDADWTQAEKIVNRGIADALRRRGVR